MTQQYLKQKHNGFEIQLEILMIILFLLQSKSFGILPSSIFFMNFLDIAMEKHLFQLEKVHGKYSMCYCCYLNCHSLVDNTIHGLF